MSDRVTNPRAPRPRADGTQCCTDTKCESGIRNNYFEGKRLTPDSFRVEQRYQLERRRLLNRAIHGWGVVYGYGVKSTPANERSNETASGRLTIGPGLALDECGRELLQTEMIEQALDQIIMLDGKDTLIPPSQDENTKAVCCLLSVHYAEQAIGPVSINDPCSCERNEWEHVCETVRYSLRPIDCGKCCNDFPCDLDPECQNSPCCEEPVPDASGNQDNAVPSEKRKTFTRGGCRSLCEHLTDLQLGGEACSLCEIEEPCARVRVDLRNGVPLACVVLVLDDCNEYTFSSNIEACGPRRLVKRSDLLFDLIRGCDLTQISKISWGDWHRGEVPFGKFKDYFGKPHSNGNGGNLTTFTVSFSRPVRADTVTADCFAMVALFHEREGGWREPLRVPIVDVDKKPKSGLIEEATLIVRTKWVNDAILGDETRFDNFGARVEIQIRGDYILDCHGQAVDANAAGLRAFPTGNGSPGGTYVSTFKVQKPTVATDQPAY